MATPVVVLFYKRLVTMGGAEVLLSEHYAYLKANGFAPKLLCFEYTDLDRIEIDPADIIEIRGRGAIGKTIRLSRLLRRLKPVQVFCHSGHVEFCMAARLARVDYAVFLHQPTTMSYNETDKYARRFFGKYRQFARRDRMYDELVEAHRALSWKRRLYINLRSHVSQRGLRRARHLFVLSEYAVREKKEIFGLTARYVAGAIPMERLERLLEKSPVPEAGEVATLVTVSRLDENKRIDLLIDAVAILRDRGKNVRLLIGGAGPAAEALKAQAGRRNLNGAVRFLGYAPEKDIGNLYESMDLFVTIDWADFRITTYEVLAENRRVVVSDDTDIDKRLLDSGYLFVAPADAEKLAEVIETGLDTPVTWGPTRLKRYLEGYTWPAYFSSIEKAMCGHA